MNKENNQGFHPITSIRFWLDNLVMMRTSLEPSRYPGFMWTREFSVELRAATTNTQKACVCAREGFEEMVEFDYLPRARYAEGLSQKAYDQIYLVALERSAQKYEALGAERRAQRIREKAEVYRRMINGRGMK